MIWNVIFCKVLLIFLHVFDCSLLDMCNSKVCAWHFFSPSFRSSYPLTQWKAEFVAGATLTQGSFQKLETPSPAFLSDSNSNCWV